jgi:GTP-binding protein
MAKQTPFAPPFCFADYPFTTVVPNLGVWVPSKDFDSPDDEDQYDEDENTVLAPSNSKSLILCDVPGLIAGASDGVGLGHAFLRHVERCHVILHLLDATSENVLEEYAMINKELLRYGTGKLAFMPQVVVVNKVDVAFGDCPNEKEARKKELELQLKVSETLNETLSKIGKTYTTNHYHSKEFDTTQSYHVDKRQRRRRRR